MGVGSHPGFHTASAEETTWAYAQLKAVAEDIEATAEDVCEVRIDDYPVVVALDMAGLTPLTDYDAVHFVRPRLVDEAREIMRAAESEGMSAREAADLSWQMQESDEFYGGAHSVQDWLYYTGSPASHSPLGSLSSYLDGLDDDEGNAFIAALARNVIADEALAEITGQFRYDEDVSSVRIVAVTYMAPFYPRVFDYETYGDDAAADTALADAAERCGWSILDVNDAGAGHVDAKLREAYRRPAGKDARVEYHGTTYRNLLAAAPELKLPRPPPPYRAPSTGRR